jgi:hypothetical protein
VHTHSAQGNDPNAGLVVLCQVQETIVPALQLDGGTEDGPRTRDHEHQPPDREPQAR